MKVSVIVPVYNAAQFVEEAVRSILAVPEVAEVVIIDDGSKDGSLTICENMRTKDARIAIYRHPEGINKGVSASRNLGMSKAKFEYIAFLDADDLFLPDRFATDRLLFEKHPDADGVYGAIGVHYHDQKGKELFERVFSSDLTTVRKAVPPERLFEVFMGVGEPILDFGNFSLDAVTVRKRSLEKMPVLLREGMAMHEDSEFVVRMSYYLRLYAGSISKAVALRGVHGENRITANDRSPRMRWHYNQILLDWAEKEVKDPRVIKNLRAQVIHGAVRSATTSAEKWSATWLMLRTPSQWKRVDTVHAWFDILSGKNTWITRQLKKWSHKLYSALWRWKGSVPPVLASDRT